MVDFCEKRVGELKGGISVIRKVLTPSFRKPRPSPSKTEPFSPEMHLKIPLLSLSSKLSNSKPGYRVSALNFFVK